MCEAKMNLHKTKQMCVNFYASPTFACDCDVANDVDDDDDDVQTVSRSVTSLGRHIALPW